MKVVSEADHGRVDKRRAHEVCWALTEHYLGEVIHVAAGHALSLRYHREKDEAIYVLSGSLDLHLEGDDGPLRVHRLVRGMSAHIPHGRRRRFEAVGNVDLVEVSTRAGRRGASRGPLPPPGNVRRLKSGR